MSEKDRKKKLEEAKERVIRAAVRYVNFEDGGTVANLYQLTDLQIKLADAVTRLEKVGTLVKATPKKKKGYIKVIKGLAKKGNG